MHGSSLLLSLRSCFHIHLISKNVANKTTAKAALTQMLDVINQRMEVHSLRSSAIEPTPEDKAEVQRPPEETRTENADKDEGAPPAESAPKGGSWSTSEGLPSFPSTFHRDSYLVFRALCRLSMRGLHDEADAAISSDSIALKNK